VKVDNPNNQRNKQSKRVGCPYSVTIWKTNNRPGDHTCMAARTDNLAWVITSVKGIHHAPCSGLDHDDPHAFFPNRQDLLPDQPLPNHVRTKIEHYVKRGRCAYKQLESMLAFDFPELVIEERQVRNAMAILKPCRSASTGQCKRLLEKLLRKQYQDDPNMSISQLLDDEDRLKGVLWVTGEQRMAWVECGSDILIHDNTYNLDALGYKLGVFSGISKMGTTIPLGACFIIDEECRSYEWQMRSFLDAHDGISPSVVITDADPAVVSVVCEVFPDATHVWCLYHLLQNIFKNCKGSISGDIGSLLSDFLTVSKTSTEDAFLKR